jgi:hypothetical protein
MQDIVLQKKIILHSIFFAQNAFIHAERLQLPIHEDR